MLAELAAANAAYATISKFVKNGREISDALAPPKASGVIAMLAKPITTSTHTASTISTDVL